MERHCMKKSFESKLLHNIELQKQYFLKKYFNYNINSINTIALFIVIELLKIFEKGFIISYFSQCGFTNYTNSKNYWELDNKNRKNLDIYHFSMIKINIHIKAILDELNKILSRINK